MSARGRPRRLRGVTCWAEASKLSCPVETLPGRWDRSAGPMGSINLSSHVSPGYVLVALGGELDVSGAAGTERALADAAAPRSRVIVDLSEPTLLDCRCVHALASAWKQA